MAQKRLSQKQVEEDFYERCKYAGVPTTGKTPAGRKRGFFTMGGAYGRIRVEYVYKCGGIDNLSGYLGARDMLMWLSNFDPVASYRYYKGREKMICESKKRREAASRGK